MKPVEEGERMSRGHGVFVAGAEGRKLPVPALLFAFLGAPVLWAGHLAASYFLVTLDCISAWGGAGWALALTTLVFAAGSAAAGWIALRLWRRLGPHQPQPDERDWARFVLLAGIGASALFTVVILMEGAAALFVPLCA